MGYEIILKSHYLFTLHHSYEARLDSVLPK